MNGIAPFYMNVRTNGTAQAKNWKYQSVQERFRWGRLFAQAFVNFSDDDLKSMFAYLQTVPAIKNRVPAPLPPPAPAH